MPAGKMAAQAGHAFLEAYLASTPASQDDYRRLSVGTKVLLQGSYPQILKLEAKLKRLAFSNNVAPGIRHPLNPLKGKQSETNSLSFPFCMIWDSEHVLLPHFTGEPIVTALGVGLHPQASHLVKNFHAWRIVS